MKSNKKFLKKIIYNHYHNRLDEFSEKGQLLIEYNIRLGIINCDSFHDVTTQTDKHATYIQNCKVFPLAKYGIEIIEESIYLKLKDSIFVSVLRDLMLIVAFVSSLYLTIITILGK